MGMAGYYIGPIDSIRSVKIKKACIFSHVFAQVQPVK